MHLTRSALFIVLTLPLLSLVANAQANQQGVAGALTKEVDEDAFPLSARISATQTVGNGFFGAGYTQVPSTATSLSLMPIYRLPHFEYFPDSTLSARFGVDVEWAESYQTTVANRIPRISDLTLAFGSSLYTEETSNISFRSTLGFRAPTSIWSRRQSLWGGWLIGAAASFSTSKWDLPVGNFTASYAPSVRLNGFTNNSPIFECGTSHIPTFQTGISQYQASPNPGVDVDIPLASPRAEEYIGDGKCRGVGRQSMAVVTQTATIGWNMGDHSVGLAFSHFTPFLRPLEEKKETTSQNAINQGFTEGLTLGDLAYTYSVPLQDFSVDDRYSLGISAGVTSFQPSWTANGSEVRFPWWDFKTPQNNFSAFYLSIAAGI